MAMIPRMMPNKIYLDDMFNDLMFPGAKINNLGNMKCDIYEKDNVYYLEMDIPGFDKNDINIELDDNDYLTIIAEKSNENIEEDVNKKYICKERSYGKYQRTFYLGGIDKDKVEADFLNGILKITMPKRQEEKSKTQRIEIK